MGLLKVNVDGAFLNGRGAAAAVVRNAEGSVVAAVAQPLVNVLGAEMSELAAALLGVRLMGACGGEFCDRGSDCVNVVNRVGSEEVDLSALAIFTEMFKSLVAPLPFNGIFHLSRDQNKLVNRLAAFALCLCHIMFWFEYVPDGITSLVYANLIS